MKKEKLRSLLLLMLPIILSSCVNRSVPDLVDKVEDLAIPINLKGELLQETFFPGQTEGVWRIVIDQLSFTSSQDISVNVIPSDETRVEVEYQQDLKEHGFAVSFVDQEIRISTDSKRGFKTERFKLDIYARYDSFSLQGGLPVRLDAEGISNLDIIVHGASKLQTENIASSELNLEIEGAGSFELSGTTDRFELVLSGAGLVDARPLRSNEATVSLEGAGNIMLSVTESLTARLDGLGAISYYGNPTVEKSGSGLGTLEQADADTWSE